MGQHKKRNGEVNKDNNMDDSLSEYQDAFQGSGCLEGEQTMGRKYSSQSSHFHTQKTEVCPLDKNGVNKTDKPAEWGKC